MRTPANPWARLRITVSSDPAAADARRVVFELTDPAARSAAGRPAAVVLRGGGELLVRYDPPAVPVPGLGKADFLRKAAEAIRADPGPRGGVGAGRGRAEKRSGPGDTPGPPNLLGRFR